MADHPIPFSAPMIRAILAGRKTQTRRIIEPHVQTAGGKTEAKNLFQVYTEEGHVRSPGPVFKLRIAVGDRLWVRETVVGEELTDGCDGVRYLADDAFVPIADTAGSVENWLDLHWYGRQGGNPELRGRSVPSIHMPKWALRLTLIVNAIMIERLQDISEADAIEEGCFRIGTPPFGGWKVDASGKDKGTFGDAIRCYRALWDSVNGPGAWEANPWVVAYSFSVVRGNIDGVEK